MEHVVRKKTFLESYQRVAVDVSLPVKKQVIAITPTMPAAGHPRPERRPARFLTSP
jgi:hypothetical protein